MPSMRTVPSLPSHLAVPSTAARWKALFLNSLNFYRVHLLTFTIIPLITSGIMYGANTTYHIDYIDCLFCCMSAMTVTGLASINLSTLSVFQQVLLFLQMIIGSLTFVSIVMILVRQYFFRQTFKHVLRDRNARSRFNISKTFSRVATIGPPLTAIRRRFSATFGKSSGDKLGSKGGSPDERTSTPSLEMKPVPPSPKKHERKHHEGHQKPKKKGHQKLRTDMIKRVSGGGVGLVNPMGWYDAERAEIFTPAPTPEREDPIPLPEGIQMEPDTGRQLSSALAAAVENGQAEAMEEEPKPTLDAPDYLTESPGHLTPEGSPRRTPYAGLQLTDDAFPRSKTIAFDDDMDDSHDFRERDRGSTTQREGGTFPRSATFRSAAGEGRFPRAATVQSGVLPRTFSTRPTSITRPDPRLTGFGGFPTPLAIGKKVFRRAFPQATKNLEKSLTMARTNTIGGRGSVAPSGTEGKEVPYISFAAVVGRNSRFTGLTQEQMDELGGVEYRALRVLLYIVVGYFVFIQLAGFVIMAPYIAAGNRYAHVFDDQPKRVRVPWFALFQSVSAFSNTGMSLVDMSMIPFQRAYLMIVVLIILIFAGNTAFPIFLRCTVWVCYKLVPETSRTRESLKFLLDHPRRCFVYLFPSTQTWFLGFVMIGLTFLVLDIGTPTIMAIPVGTRIAAGFLQSAAVRAAGFGIVALGNLAPAVKYISVYPIALSVRATNVYEEKSLGLFDEEAEDDDFGEGEETEGAQAVAKYVGWHARRQLAFDIWWLGFALWLVCIIERGHIDDDREWFDIFNIVFELVSAYGTVGLSLGVAYDNYSFSGSFRKLSKLVVIAVMLRGRHRGLPVAIDRAVMLPKDFTAAEETAFEEERSRRASRRASMFTDEVFTHTRRGSSGGMSLTRNISPISQGPVTAPPYQPNNPNSGGTVSHRRSSSFGGMTVPGSPSSGGLQFSLPREGFDRDRERGGGRGPPVGIRGGGALTPVREGTMSRNPTVTLPEGDRDDSAIV
ncbi:hypothetical protein IAR55_001013 [Kwoniella newhampshirensis]|uniref:Potassium transport protein n=1 Tax=Kwoniella newhampshirensis TaxID=1651941 RepID=A0AAW0Z4J9_9TREE